jgi:hypothetical protein
MQKKYVILTSKIGNGLYFPALFFRNELMRLGIEIDFFIFEDFLTAKIKRLFENAKRNNPKDEDYNFKSYNLFIEKLGYGTNKYKINNLVKHLKNNNNFHIICFSNIWILFLKKLKFENNLEFKLSWITIDVESFNKWNNLKEIYKSLIYNHYEFFHLDPCNINYIFNFNKKLIPFEHRKNQITIHGGGWSIGNYESKLNLLVTNFNINLISIQTNNLKQINLYSDDFNYNFHENLEFPSFGKFNKKLNRFNYKKNIKHHGVFDLILNSKAIISKPGGMTIIDSIIAETPIIYLKPFNQLEAKNSEFLESLNIGMSYANWQKLNFSTEVLMELQKNIIFFKKKSKNIITEFLIENS